MRMRVSKKRGWKKTDIKDLREMVNTMTNQELCDHFKIDLPALQHVFNKYKIKRPTELVSQMRSDNLSGESNPNWKGGISKDTARYLRIQRERYPERKHARDAVYRALKDGTLTKPVKCQHCGEERYLEGHHHSYKEEHWLDVEWLCKPCHNVADKEAEGAHRDTEG